MPPGHAESIARLATAFPRPQLDERRLALYVEELSDVPADVLEQAVRALVRTRTSDWMPPVGAVREAAAEVVLGLPSEAEALAQVERRIRWARDADEDSAGPPVDPLVADALRLVGGYHAFRTTDQPSIVRSQFAKLYREARAAAVREVQEGGPRRPLRPTG